MLGLACFRDNAQREIAIHTGLPLVHVRVLLGRAQQKLRQQFAGPAEGRAAVSTGRRTIAR